MDLRAFTTLDQLRNAPYDLPSTLVETAENQEGRGERWAVFLYERNGREIWTLVMEEDRAAIQWREGEPFHGEWVRERAAVRMDEEPEVGLFSLEGRRLPEDPFNDEDEEGGTYDPAFGKKDKLNI